MECNKCNVHHCPREHCGCARPILEVSRESGDSPVLKFNVNGVTSTYDYQDLVHDLQTDTSLAVDVAKRVLRFIAEKHQDAISAKELGAILHLGDLGDVDTKKAETGSLLKYKKDDTCAEGCVGTSNKWEVWNALDNTNDRFVYPSGFDATGNIVALRKPMDVSKYTLLGWNADRQVSWLPFSTRANKVAGDYVVCADKDTHQLYFAETL